MIYDITECDWDPRLLEALRIPRAMLPSVVDSSAVLGETDPEWFGRAIPIAGMAGDQQAALFGQGCFEPGRAKNTYGTGCFLLLHTGARPRHSTHGLLTTIAWRSGGRVEYAIEGSVFVAGAAVQWLRDGLRLVASAHETEAAARSVPDSGGVYLVPAFVGLGAPYWDEQARGAIVGLTRGTTREHLIRATLESIAYQTRDVVDCMTADAGRPPDRLRADGGASRNDFLMQLQADLLGVPVERPRMPESTAFGAAALAGLAVGFFRDRREIESLTAAGTVCFEPQLEPERREVLYAGWKRAVERATRWAQE
jgi:glycerol kinase